MSQMAENLEPLDPYLNKGRTSARQLVRRFITRAGDFHGGSPDCPGRGQCGGSRRRVRDDPQPLVYLKRSDGIFAAS